MEFASASVTVSVLSTILVSTAVINQGYNTLPSNPDFGYFDFQTVVEYPFEMTLNSPSTLDGVPPGMTATISSLTSTIATGTGTYSTQTWRVLINPGSNCVLNGVYTLTNNHLKPACISGASCAAPIDPTSFTFGITSDNFCATTVANVDVEASLASYSNAGLTSTSNVFLISASNPARAYFLASATSNQVSVQGVTVVGVSVSCSTIGTQVLYNSALTSEGTTLGLNVTGPSFSFLVSTAFSVTQDQQTSCTITAQMQVAYVGGGRKRMELQATLAPAQTATSFTLFAEVGSSGMIVIPSIIVVLGTVLLSLFL